MARTIYSVSTFGVYVACFCFPSRSRCLLSVVRTTYSVSTFCDPYYLLGVYFRCLLCVLLLLMEIEVSTLCNPYYLLGVYFRCPLFVLLLFVKIEASTFGGPCYRPRDHGQPNRSLGNRSLVLRIYIEDSTDKLFRGIHVYICRITQLPMYAHRK